MSGRISYLGGIVKNGLILDLDAAKQDSYPRLGTSWKDISGNGNNTTLINSPTFNSGNGGIIVFDGVDDYANTNLTATPTSVTIEIACSVTSNTSTKTGGNTVAQYIVFRQNINTSYFEGVMLAYVQSGPTGYITAGMTNPSNNTYRNVDTTSINFNQIYLISVTYTSSYIKMYVNGTFVTQTTTGFPISYNPIHTFKIGRADAISQTFDGYLNGKIYSLKLYDRELSSSDILQNYNALKSRLNI